MAQINYSLKFGAKMNVFNGIESHTIHTLRHECSTDTVEGT